MTKSEWKQRLIDWEKRDRCLEVLRRHLVACRFSRSQIELLVSCARDGQAITDQGASRSLLSASKAQVARLTGLSPTAVHKAKEALVAAGLMRYTRGHYLASWSRVWDLRPPPDPVEAMLAAPDEGRLVTTGHHRSPPVTTGHRARQEPKKEESKSSKTQYQETKNPRIGAEPLLQEGGAAGVETVQIACERSQENQVERIANRLLAAAHGCERRCGITDSDRRLKPHTARALARALARAVAYFGDDVLEEYHRLLDSLGTHEIENSGGYLVGAFKRRGWWNSAEKADAL